MALERLRQSLRETPVVWFGEYPYFVHPITDGIPLGRPEVLDEVVREIARVGNWDCDKVTTAESMGFPLAAAVSLRVGKPYVFIRKRKYGLPGEIAIAQATGYGKATLYANNLNPGDRVVFVDDVLSTGGTIRAIAAALKAAGVRLVDVIVVFEKTREKAKIETEIGVKIKTLMKVEVAGGKVVEWS